MIKVSIIVPVYNAAANITQCLDSLRAQTMTDIEVIFVDDHGKDDSIKIIQQYITTYSLSNWIICKTEKNSGPGLARNIGIKNAKGEYIAFMDADDWCEPNMYATLYNLCCNKTIEVAMCNAIMHTNNKTKILKNPPFTTNNQYLSKYIAYLWTYIFRREFILNNDILFPVERSSEDSYFIAAAIMCASEVEQTEQTLYHYIIYPTSISHVRNTKRYKQKFKVFLHLIQFAKQRNLFAQYRWTLCWIYFKKAIVSSVVDYISSIMATSDNLH